MLRLPQVQLCGALVQHRAFAAAAFSQLWKELLQLSSQAVASPPHDVFLKAEAKSSERFFAGLQDLEQKLRLQIASVSTVEPKVAVARPYLL